jgi:tRNA(Ile2) C34 agmatinyltransferase TiaS
MKITVNKAQCKKCGDIIESKYTHDFVCCSCNNLCVDGGKDYMKRSIIEVGTYVELSEYEIEGENNDN